VPPLRERPEDIPALVHHFVNKFARQFRRRSTVVPAATMDTLQAAHWPGNIRELEHFIERAVILSPGSELKIPSQDLHPPKVAHANTPPNGDSMGQLRSAERDLILKALRECRGVISGSDGAAARLGLKRTTLQSKMRKLGIIRPSF